MRRKYTHIVIGAGAIGASAAYWLSRRPDTRVLALEQFSLGHTQGASEDHSRVIRHAYDQPHYTALTPAMFQTWRVVEEATGLDLIHKTGNLVIGAKGSDGEAAIVRSAAAMATQNLPYEELTATEIRRRWPQWNLNDNHVGLFDPEGGILNIRQATAAHIALARSNGATVVPNAQVTGLIQTDAGVTVTVNGEQYCAGSVVMAGGAWNPILLRLLGTSLPITLSEEQVTYFATPNVKTFQKDRFPVYGLTDEDGLFYYGFPIYGEVATKIGIDRGGPVVTADTRTYARNPKRVRKVEEFLSRYLPAALGPELYTRVCCYDFPPDYDFIIDQVPGFDRIHICVGSGHAGKFAALLGRILSELATEGASRFPIAAFRADRPALLAAQADCTNNSEDNAALADRHGQQQSYTPYDDAAESNSDTGPVRNGL